MQPVFRFAPSPNGLLHVGHAYSALLNKAMAAKLEGRLLLRLEDIDVVRCRPQFVDGILEDLAWLGISYEKPVRRQSEHFGDYRNAVGRLHEMQALYPCFCSRKEIAETSDGRVDPDGAPLYPGTCRKADKELMAKRLAAGEPHTLRLDLAKARSLYPNPISYSMFDYSFRAETVDAWPERWGDAILVRKDTPTSYHLSVVVDDALQGVTHVVRGMDLEAATDLHALLQKLLGLPTPSYHHHPLIRDDEGDKLSKSFGSKSLADLRAQGMNAADLLKSLGF